MESNCDQIIILVKTDKFLAPIKYFGLLIN